MQPLEYVFLADTTSAHRPPLMAFCKKEGLSREAAREQVRNVLQQEFPDVEFRIGFVGELSYRLSEVEKEVYGQLKWFKKYDPVWLFGQG